MTGFKKPLKSLDWKKTRWIEACSHKTWNVWICLNYNINKRCSLYYFIIYHFYIIFTLKRAYNLWNGKWSRGDADMKLELLRRRNPIERGSAYNTVQWSGHLFGLQKSGKTIKTRTHNNMEKCGKNTFFNRTQVY